MSIDYTNGMASAETKVKDKEVRSLEKSSFKSLASGTAPGLRLVSYVVRQEAESYLEHGFVFGSSLGAHELKGPTTPLYNANNEGILNYQTPGDPAALAKLNEELLVTRRRLEKGWTNTTLLFVFPDDDRRYRTIDQLRNEQGDDETYSKEDIYITYTIQWLNQFIDFNPVGQQIVPRAFIGGFIDLDKMELVRNLHYGESFVQSSTAKQRLPTSTFLA